jgi:hypothetical protein
MKRTKVKMQRSVSPDGSAQAESWASVTEERLGEGLSEVEVMTRGVSGETSSQSSSQSRVVPDSCKRIS